MVSFSPGSLRYAGGTVAGKNHIGLRNPKVLKPAGVCVGVMDGRWQPRLAGGGCSLDLTFIWKPNKMHMSSTPCLPV